ncbi:MAG: CpXC domain-containing protein [Treponema sp.]|nr:CpXC domain-containing protein [Treponema sp.]
MKRNIACPCSANFQINYEDEIDLDLSPDTLDKILNGTFMSYTCSNCGKKHKPELKITVIWKSKNLKMEVIPELDRGEFYRNKKEKSQYETVIGFPEMSDRLSIIKDNLEPVIIETLKSFLLSKAADNYPDKDINAWYYSKDNSGIEFHLDGIRTGEMAVMKIPMEIYTKTLDDYQKRPKNSTYSSLRVRSYLSVQNLLRPDALK